MPRASRPPTPTPSAPRPPSITKTDNDGDLGHDATARPCRERPITYTIVASNTGPSKATGAIGHRSSGPQPDHQPPTPGRPPARRGHRLQRLGSGQHQRLCDHPGSAARSPTRWWPSSVLGHRHPVQHGHRLGLRRHHGHAPPTPTPSSPKATLAITKTDNDGGSSIPRPGHGRAGRPPSPTPSWSRTPGRRPPPGRRSTDPLALNPAITSDTWTATATGGATGFSASGSGSISDSRHHPCRGLGHLHGGGRHQPSATGTLTNTATASASDASTVTATDTDTLSAQATLAITNTDGVSSIVAGTSDTYTIVVSNPGLRTPPT